MKQRRDPQSKKKATLVTRLSHGKCAGGSQSPARPSETRGCRSLVGDFLLPSPMLPGSPYKEATLPQGSFVTPTFPGPSLVEREAQVFAHDQWDTFGSQRYM